MVGAVFSKLSDGNDALYGSILAPLRQVIVDNCSVDTEDEKLLRAMFVVEQSSMRQEHTTFKNHLTIYAEMLEDAKTGSAAHKAKGLFAQFGEAYVRTKIGRAHV